MAIQTRPNSANEPVLGLVTNTGFLTTKGTLVRDILYPQEIKFRFYDDAMKFVAIMFIIAFIGFVAIFPILVMRGASTNTLIDRSLNLVVIAVPPALPAAMSCGIVFAIQRLKSQKIFCISPPRVNLAGRITTFVFDKTGTLTEDGLSLHGLRPTTDQASFSQFRQDAKDLLPSSGTQER